MANRCLPSIDFILHCTRNLRHLQFNLNQWITCQWNSWKMQLFFIEFSCWNSYAINYSIENEKRRARKICAPRLWLRLIVANSLQFSIEDEQKHRIKCKNRKPLRWEKDEFVCRSATRHRLETMKQTSDNYRLCEANKNGSQFEWKFLTVKWQFTRSEKLWHWHDTCRSVAFFDFSIFFLLSSRWQICMEKERTNEWTKRIESSKYRKQSQFRLKCRMECMFCVRLPLLRRSSFTRKINNNRRWNEEIRKS